MVSMFQLLLRSSPSGLDIPDPGAQMQSPGGSYDSDGFLLLSTLLRRGPSAAWARWAQAQLPKAVPAHKPESRLDGEMDLGRSAALFLSFIVSAVGLYAMFDFAFDEVRGVASPRAWWLLTTGCNGVLLSYAMWSWIRGPSKTPTIQKRQCFAICHLSCSQ